MRTVRQIFAVFRKELVDGARDRRSISSLAFSAVIAPLLFGLMFTVAAERRKSADEIRLPVQGAEHAPAFVDWLTQQSGVTIVAAPTDAEQAVATHDEDVVLIIDDQFGRDMARAVPATVKLVSDVTRENARMKVARVRNLVATYSGMTGGLRLLARGVAPGVATAIRVEDVEVSTSQQRLAMQLSILPLLLVIAALTGGMQLAIDSTAGERERGSLEPLLLNPVSRQALAAGKWLAASAFGCGAVVFSMVLTVTVMRRVPWHDLGIRFRVSDTELMTLLLLILPLALFLSALVMFASTFARSFKEAQTYLGMLMLVPMLPGIVSTIYPLAGRPWLAPVPVLGQYALAADVLGGKPPHVVFYILAAASVLLCAGILVGLTARLLGREAIVFGR
ncbi:MAG: ABC transporter permease [Acidobacteria bacterium]|nr:ABC transporter permease [Acidobacteriota bacterium]